MTNGKTSIWNKVISVLVLVGLLVIILRGATTEPAMIDPGKYDYCTEWDGFINREDLLRGCFNYKTLEIECDWNVSQENELTLFDYNNKSMIINTRQCTRLVKSVRIDIDG